MADETEPGAQQAPVRAESLDVDELVEDAFEQCDVLWRKFGVPGDVVVRRGSAAFSLKLGDQMAQSGDELWRPRAVERTRERAKARRREGQEMFAELCASAPSVPEDALKSLSLASGALSILEKSLEEGGVKADQSSARTLMMLMVAIGHALGSFGEPANAVSE
jgi:hypothetical protein